MIHPVHGTLALAAALALLAGCSTTPSTPLASTDKPAMTAAAMPTVTPVATPAATPAVVSQSSVSAAGLPGAGAQPGATAAGGGAAAMPMAGTAMLAAPVQRIVYFDFDSFVIKDDFKALLDGHAKVLAANQSRRMVIEGHTDERGGREYNLALGQKRAEAVVHSLTLLGASERQLEAVSFGKERPAVAGSDENAWSRNRRAELKDR